MAKPTHHVVLIPGLDGTGQLFDPFISALPPGIETSTVSFPHDRCIYDPDLFACIRNVMPWNREFIVLAESASGAIGLRFAAAQRENVKAVILVSSAASNPLAANANWATVFLSKPWYEKPVTPASVRKHLLGANATDTLVNATVTALRTPWPEVLGHRIELMKKLDARDALQGWDKPIFYLRAEQDEFIPSKSVEEITRLNPTVEVASVPGPHLVLQANPHAAAAAIGRFIESLNQPATGEAAA